MRYTLYIVCVLVIVMIPAESGWAESVSRVVTGDVIANRTVTLGTRIKGADQYRHRFYPSRRLGTDRVRHCP